MLTLEFPLLYCIIMIAHVSLASVIYIYSFFNSVTPFNRTETRKEITTIEVASTEKRVTQNMTSIAQNRRITEYMYTIKVD